MNNPSELQNIMATLKQDNLPVNQINEFLLLANKKLICDTECQKKRTSNELQKKWSTDQKELKNLPKQISDDEKKYIVFTHGEKFYENKVLKPKYDLKAAEFSFAERKKLQAVKTVMDVQLTSYNGMNIALDRITQLHNDLKEKNVALKKDIDNHYNSTLTSERRVYYEINDTQHLQYYNKYLRILYFVFLGLYLVFGSFFRNGGYKKPIIWLYLIIYSIIPFVLSYIIDYFYDFNL
jgi:hypothetical protein